MNGLEKEIDELMQRGALGTTMALEGMVHGLPRNDPKAVENLFELYGELFGVQRKAILRLAREIDELRGDLNASG